MSKTLCAAESLIYCMLLFQNLKSAGCNMKVWYQEMILKLLPIFLLIFFILVHHIKSLYML